MDSENFFSVQGTVDVGALDQGAKGGKNRYEITSKENSGRALSYLLPTGSMSKNANDSD